MAETIERMYLDEQIKRDYDIGYSIEVIAERYKASRFVDFENKISSKKAYEKVCQIIYAFIMERGSIVKKEGE